MKEEPRTEFIAFRVAPSEMDQIRFVAHLDRRNVSDWVRLVIFDAISECMDAKAVDEL